jgi:hypothetical protein
MTILGDEEYYYDELIREDEIKKSISIILDTIQVFKDDLIFFSGRTREEFDLAIERLEEYISE